MKKFIIIGQHKPKHTTSGTKLNVILRLRRKRRITTVVPLEPVLLVDLQMLNVNSVNLKSTCMHLNEPFLFLNACSLWVGDELKQPTNCKIVDDAPASVTVL